MKTIYQQQVDRDTARMLCDVYLRPKTINERRAEDACGHWMQRTARRKASIMRGNWAMTPSDYYSRHERREPLSRRESVVFAIAFIFFVALCAVVS